MFPFATIVSTLFITYTFFLRKFPHICPNVFKVVCCRIVTCGKGFRLIQCITDALVTLTFHMQCITTSSEWSFKASLIQRWNACCIRYMKDIGFSSFSLFRSPEPKAQGRQGDLFWSLCRSSVINHPLLLFCFRQHLLINHWINFNQTSQE